MLKRLLILLFIPFILCACTKSAEEEITFASWGSITEVSIIENVIKDFEQKNPNIKVNFMHIPQNYFQKIHLLFASNQAPDVIFINNLYLPLYANKLEPLNDLVNENDFYAESLKAMSYENKLFAIPRDISNLVFYRNKELVQKKPQNLEELIDAIKDVKPYGISYERDVYFIFPYVLTFNEDIYHPKNSLKFYRNLEGKYAPTPDKVGSSTQAQMFLDKKIGLYLSGKWMYPKIKEKANFDWDVITFCGMVPLDSSGWAISNSSKHKETAEKFVQFLTSKESIEYFNTTGLIVPARKDVKVDNPIFIEAIKKSKALTIDKNYKKITDKMNKELFR